MLETVLGMLGLPASRCLLIGDRLSTDIAMAVAAGIDSALVLTGETTPVMAAVATELPTRRAAAWSNQVPCGFRVLQPAGEGVGP